MAEKEIATCKRGLEAQKRRVNEACESLTKDVDEKNVRLTGKYPIQDTNSFH